MLFSFLPLVLIVLGLAIIIAIIIRKFPQLRVLDVDGLPEEQARKKKDKILEKKFDLAFKPLQSGIDIVTNTFEKYFGQVQSKFRTHVDRVADKYRAEYGRTMQERAQSLSPRERARQLNHLIEEGDELRHDDDLIHAEEKYIAAINFEPKSVRAYRGLGKVYFEQERYVDAKETFKFLMKLDKNDDIAPAYLGRVAKAEKRWEEAATWYERAIKIKKDVTKRWLDLAAVYEEMSDREEQAKKALLSAYALEPKNPAILDEIIHFAISHNDRALAREKLAELQEVNPENQKLPGLKNTVQGMR